MSRYYFVPVGSRFFVFDIIIFGIFFSLIPWAIFRYNWPFAVVTFFIFGYLYFYFYRRNKLLRYICTGVSSIIYGMICFSIIPLCSNRPINFEGTKQDISVALAIFGFMASFYYHLKEYREVFNLKDEYRSSTHSLTEIKTNRLAAIVLIASSIIFVVSLKYAIQYVKSIY